MSSTTTTTTTTAYAQPRRRPVRDRDSMGNSTSGVEAKVVVMGSAGVGKTSLVQRYTSNAFNSTKIAATAGAGFHVKKTVVEGIPVRLQLWDTAGQERFRSLAPMYYRGSHAALLVYDITNPSSFDDIRVWLEELKKNMPADSENDMIIYIVGAKSDLAPRQRRVTKERVQSTLAEWFPPPKPPTPPPAPSMSSALIPYYAPGYPFTSASSVYPSSHFNFPSQLSSISTSVSTHLPALPSFNLGLPNLNQIRPRFTSLTTSSSKSMLSPPVTRQGESPTGTDSTAGTGESAVTANTSTSGFHQQSNSFMPPPAPSSGSRFAFPRSSTTSAVPNVSNLGLNVNMSGSQYSGFARSGGDPVASSSNEIDSRPRRASGSGRLEFPGAPGLVRRNTTGVALTPSSSRPRASPTGRSRLDSCMSDDEDQQQRGRERRPAAYRRFNEVENVKSYADVRRESSSGDELDRMIDFRPGGPGAVRAKKEQDQKDKERRKRKEEEDRRRAQEAEAAAAADDDFPYTRPWGFSKDFEVREVSAKDGQGVDELFASLLHAIIRRRDVIDRERRLRERDSVLLNVPTSVPTWGTLAEEDDVPSGASGPATRKTGWTGCCGI